MMFNKSKARWALLIDLHEELIRKIDEQIGVEKKFIETLNNFFFFEKKLEKERFDREEIDASEKKVTKADREF